MINLFFVLLKKVAEDREVNGSILFISFTRNGAFM